MVVEHILESLLSQELTIPVLPEKELLFDGTPAIRGEHKDARYCLYPLEGKYAAMISIGSYMRNWYLDTDNEYEAYTLLDEYVTKHRQWLSEYLKKKGQENRNPS